MNTSFASLIVATLLLPLTTLASQSGPAVFVEKGQPPRLDTLQVPDPQPGQVRVRLRAAGVNPVDWKRVDRAAAGAPAFVPGYDGAGEIDAVGDGVAQWKVGDAVVVHAGGAPTGTYARYVVVPVSSVAPKPAKLTFEQTAGLPVAAETAWRTLDTAQVKAGQRVLVTGGAGGVGSATVQLAKARGAWVAATASPRNHEYLRSLGVDEVIDYNSVRFEKKIKNLDAVINTVDDRNQTATLALKTLRRGGVLVSITGLPEQQAADAAGVRISAPERPTGNSGGLSSGAVLTEIGKLADANKFQVSVESVLPLAQVIEAWTKSKEGHTRGKLVLQID